MPIKTQMRLTQMTGSLGSGLGQINDAESAVASLDAADLSDVLSAMASSMKRLHGDAAFHGNPERTIIMTDNQASGFVIKNVTDDYFKIVTTNGATNQAVQIPRDDVKLKIGAGQDLVLYHDGTDSEILNTTGQFRIMGDDLRIRANSADEAFITAAKDGAVAIFHDNAEVATTEATGLRIPIAGAANLDIGTDADGADRTVVFGHTTLKSVMGIDDSNDAFVINTDATFDATLSDNAFSIDTNNDVIIGRHLTTGGDITVSGGDIDVDSAKALNIGATVGANNITLGASNSTVVVSGNLTVSGTTTTVDTATLTVEDPLIKLASGNDSSDAVDIGLYGLYDVGGTDKYTGLFRDTNDSKYHLFKDLEAEPTTTVNKSGAGYAVATLVANFEGALTGDVTGTSSLSTVTDSTDNTNFPIVFHDESNALLDSQFIEINPSNKRIQFTGGDAADVATIAVDANGGLLLTTVDAAAAAAHMVLTADGDITLDAEADINLDAKGNDIVFKDDGTSIGKITNFTIGGGTDFKLEAQAGHLSMQPALNKNINLALFGGNEGVAFVDATTGASFGFVTGSATSLILSGGASNDIEFKINNGGASVKVASFDASAGSFHMEDNAKIEFGDAGESIHGDGSDLLVRSSRDLIMDVTNKIEFDSDAYDFRLLDNGTERFQISMDGNDNTIFEGKGQDDDIIFKVNDGGSANEVFRVGAADSILKLAASNTAGTNPGVLQFGAPEEQIWGDTSALFIESNGVVLKMPTVAGSNGQVLQVNGSGELSFVNQSAGAVTAKKFWQILTGSVAKGDFVGTTNNVNWSTYGGGTDKQIDLSGIEAADEARVVDVYVNGQLMLSGSESDRAAGNVDYHLLNQAGVDRANMDLKFAFQLEADDVVAVIARS